MQNTANTQQLINTYTCHQHNNCQNQMKNKNKKTGWYSSCHIHCRFSSSPRRYWL